jgi:hypothetical protein
MVSLGFGDVPRQVTHHLSLKTRRFLYTSIGLVLKPLRTLVSPLRKHPVGLSQGLFREMPENTEFPPCGFSLEKNSTFHAFPTEGKDLRI